MLVILIPLIIVIKFLDEYTTYLALHLGLSEKSWLPSILYNNFGVYGHIINFSLMMLVIISLLLLANKLPYGKYLQVIYGSVHIIYMLNVVIHNAWVITGYLQYQ